MSWLDAYFQNLGIGIQNAGVPLGSGTFLKLNLSTGLSATDSGGGVALLTATAGSGGVQARNNGTPIAGGPFTTLNYNGITGANAGSGVLNVTASPTAAQIVPGTADQLLVTNHAASATMWVTAGGDLTYASGSFTVASIQGVVISGTPSASQVLTATSPTAAHWATPTAGGYTTIQNAGNPLTQRAILDFEGAGVTAVDDSGSTRTKVTIPGSVGVGSGNALNVPSAASYTITGTLALTDISGGGLFVTKPNAVNNQVDTALIGGGTFSSTGWYVEMLDNEAPTNNGQFPGVGPCVATGTTSSDTAYATFRYYGNSTVNAHGAHFHPGSTRISFLNDAAIFPPIATAGYSRMRLLSDGTNLYYQFSVDGFFWIPWVSEALPASIAFWGLCMGNGSGSGTDARMAMSVYRNRQSPTLNVPQTAIQTVTNVGTPSIQSNGHGLITGDVVAIHGVVGATGVNTSTGNGLGGLWIATVTDANHFTVPAGAPGAYVSGGVVTCLSR